MGIPRVLMAALFALAGLGVGPGTAMAATGPVIQGTTEVGIPEDGGRMLLVYGKNLTKVTSWEIDEADGTLIAPLVVVFKGKTLTGLALPSNFAALGHTLPGQYSLKFVTKAATDSVLIHLTGGLVAEAAHAKTADDATTVGGESVDELHDAGLLTGSFPSSLFSAYDDLMDESKVGTGAGQVAAGGHDHDADYPMKTDLSTAGTINTGGNPMDWTRLKNVPAGLADGVDDGAAYTNGTGLSLVGTTFAVIFGTTGTTVAAGNHTHTTTYLGLAGGTLTGTLTINASGQAVVATSGATSDTAGGIDCVTKGGVGVAGHGNIGVLGDLDSDGRYGVWGNATYDNQRAVYASASGYSSQAVFAQVSGGYSTAVYAGNSYGGRAIEAYSSAVYSATMRVSGYSGTAIYATTGNGTGVYASSYTGTAIHARSNSGTALSAYVNGYKGGTGLKVNCYYYLTDLAVFQYRAKNLVRVDSKGNVHVNGGLYSGSADFAESVKVDRPVDEFEPGDVMVIDPKAPRQFALSREASSPLVAGVISTKPALLGSAHDVASPRGARKLKEEVKLGIVGIVPTKVCDEGGEIRIGDLLVSASVPGHARKAPANPAVGTVIGKALGALDHGTGRIEVLLMAR